MPPFLFIYSYVSLFGWFGFLLPADIFLFDDVGKEPARKYIRYIAFRPWERNYKEFLSKKKYI